MTNKGDRGARVFKLEMELSVGWIVTICLIGGGLLFSMVCCSAQGRCNVGYLRDFSFCPNGWDLEPFEEAQRRKEQQNAAAAAAAAAGAAAAGAAGAPAPAPAPAGAAPAGEVEGQPEGAARLPAVAAALANGPAVKRVNSPSSSSSLSESGSDSESASDGEADPQPPAGPAAPQHVTLQVHGEQ
jgi:hypothetical protein